MAKIVPPFCLVLAILSLVAAFALVMTGPPDVGIELHQARIGDDDEYRLLLEQQLHGQRRKRQLMIAALIASGILLTVTAFLAMRPVQSRGAS